MTIKFRVMLTWLLTQALTALALGEKPKSEKTGKWCRYEIKFRKEIWMVMLASRSNNHKITVLQAGLCLPKFIYSYPSFSTYLRMWPYLIWGIYRNNQVEPRSLGWMLIQYSGCSYRKGHFDRPYRRKPPEDTEKQKAKWINKFSVLFFSNFPNSSVTMISLSLLSHGTLTVCRERNSLSL